ncbi:putative coproporphyrinogen dehydrogenase [Leptospira ryugenii]|uniref:Heme chaperone HemW n=1 Tax=Leptospira ryugenii TaxID=1917863 RepID=A0A2P2DYM4_9LEPT|nr:radical SAM family heme chaperone HemW [Leptospira ryugenii]GBF49712.1 putative coproporphyrinogen dehydrogenase [Leptospira ryugenii]
MTLSNMTAIPLRANKGKLGIYVHFPFCYQKCDYCDFYSEGIGKENSPLEKQLFNAYKLEFLERKKLGKECTSFEVDSIFFGGGTPSKAEPSLWRDLLQFLQNELNISKGVEITLEANPEDLSLEAMGEWQAAGINRLNIGVQTRAKAGLTYLGRYVDEKKYQALDSLCKNSPIPRLGVDLMYGIPGQSFQDFLEDLDSFLSLPLAHFSMYSLTVEKGTAYSRQVNEKRKESPNEELQYQVLEYLPERMKTEGFEWYEVSNYARNGAFSRHNLRYWMYEPYLGLGPGAHGFIDQNRYGNPRNTGKYLKDPMSAKSEPASPAIELALTLFRIFLPMDLLSFTSMHLNEREQESYLRTILDWQSKGLCLWNGRIFHWKESAIFKLDDLILQLCTTLEN